MGLDGETAVILIDMQDCMIDDLPERPQLVRNLQDVLRHCAAEDVYVAAVEYDIIGSVLSEFQGASSIPYRIFRHFPELSTYVDQKKRIPLQHLEELHDKGVHQPTTGALTEYLHAVPRHDVWRKSCDNGLSSDLVERLRENNVGTTYIVGVNRAWCVRSTAIKAYGCGFKIVLAEDTMANSLRACDRESRMRDQNATEFYSEKGILAASYRDLLPLRGAMQRSLPLHATAYADLVAR